MYKNILLFVLSLCIVALAKKAPLLDVHHDDAVPNQFMVVFKSNITDSDRQQHLAEFQKSLSSFPEGEGKIMNTFEFEELSGYSAKIPQKLLKQLRHSSDVEYIEADKIVRAVQTCKAQNNAPWGLNRVSSTKVKLDGVYKYGSEGSSVTAYVIDTGIRTTHNEFQGRAVWGGNFIDSQNTDCNGHGTHVAGTIGGATYGVAKKVTLSAVKVLDCDGYGTDSSVIQGIQFVTKNAQNPAKTVANMSLGGGKSTTLDNAVKAAIKKGITFAVAAGNENDDACNGSPSSVAEAITVGATTIEDELTNEVDQRSSFSNYGKCVDIFAPGELIQSAWIDSDSATLTISGTSMATPHVAGAAALYLDANSATPAQVSSYLTSSALQGVIDMDCSFSSCSNSANKLLHYSC